jgi:hypothetical protein
MNDLIISRGFCFFKQSAFHRAAAVRHLLGQQNHSCALLACDSSSLSAILRITGQGYGKIQEKRTIQHPHFDFPAEKLIKE